MFFCHFQKGEQLCDFLFASPDDSLFKVRSTLKGKNLLLEKQILPFKVRSTLKGKNLLLKEQILSFKS